MDFKIRKAQEKDLMNVFELSNDDVVRANSINVQKIELESHKQWFKEKISSEGCFFYIVETLDDEFIGQVRIEDSYISISIGSKFRGKGLGSELIRQSTKLINAPVFAIVKRNNLNSLNAFIKAGYVIIEQDTDVYKLKYDI